MGVSMARRGPKLKTINWEEVDKLCFMQCTQEEIAAWFGCDIETIDRICKREAKKKFSVYFNEKKQGGKISLRRKLFQMAVNTGNPAALIFACKNYLGMSDCKREVDIDQIHAPVDNVRVYKVQWGSSDEASGSPLK